ncbi:MAG: lysoplasmalogenase [Chitinophagaceae bacterium]
MKKKYWILLFAVVLIGDLVGIQLQQKGLQFIFKPLIIPVLFGYLDAQTTSLTKGLCQWISAALFFSLLGDTLLMFDEKDPIFFMLGLAAFLIAHIFYILFFYKVRVREQLRIKPGLGVVVIVYYAALVTLLYPHLADMKIPVLVYGLVISFMFMLAMHMLFIKNISAGKWMMVGALLFVISDSTLAINKFYKPFEMAGVLIMLTYGLAQLFIVEGAGRYIISVNKEKL